MVKGGKVMKKVLRNVTIMILVLCMALTPCTIALATSNITVNNALDFLHKTIVEGKILTYGGETPKEPITAAGDYWVDYSKDTFDNEGGGYSIWADIVNDDAIRTGCINPAAFGILTKGAQQEFLKDVLTLCNYTAAFHTDVMSGKIAAADANDSQKKKFCSTQTVNEYSKEIQQLAGAGSTLIASLMQNTKPDYATANKIYMPFSGPLGVALGLIAILIMALLGVTMALDIAYIVIPALRIALDSDDGGGKGGEGGSKKVMSRIISDEAKSAVKSAEGTGDTGQAGSGNKLAIGTYFKARWKSLLLLGICLLYLVQGQIYSLIAWIIDLVSGFVGA